MRKENQLDSVLKASFLGIFLFAFLILPIGCNQTSTPESTNINSQDNVEPQIIAETQDVAESQEVAQVVENIPDSNEKEIVLLSGDDDWNLLIGFMNTCSIINPIDIKAYLDGKLVVDQDLYYHQHMPTPFYFKLAEGEHSLKVESVKGEASLNKTFQVKGRNYSDVSYYYHPAGEVEYDRLIPKHFTFTIRNRPAIRF